MKKIIKSLCLLLLLLAMPAASICQQNVELNFTAVNGPASIAVVPNGSPSSVSLQICTNDNREWRTYGIGQSIQLTSGSTVYFRTPSASGFNRDNWNHYYFTMTGTVSAAGNIMSLLDPTMQQTSVPPYAFYGLFEGCSSLVSAPMLPALTLDTNSYSSMFKDCTSLTAAPQLPATNFNGSYCYSNMFRGCTSLSAAPALASTTIGRGCYSSMFLNCTSLVDAPALPATELKEKCYQTMFVGCSSLTTPPELPADSVPLEAYTQMFEGCTSLAQAPDLPATILGAGCYAGMFSGCTALTTIPALPATELPVYCYTFMFFGCTSLALDTIGPGREWSIPADTAETDAVADMFAGTSGSMNGTPELGTIYYISSETYAVTLEVNDSLMGNVDVASGTYHYGDTLTVTATANDGYRFVAWSNGDTTATISFVVTSDTAFLATFDTVPVVEVESVGEADIVVAGNDGKIVVEGAEGRFIAIYDAMGRMIAAKNRTACREIVNVPAAGLYIVNIDGRSSKVIVK